MSNVIHLAGQTRRHGVAIHVDTNPPWEAITFGDTDGEPILCYNEREGWVLHYFDEDAETPSTLETGMKAPRHIHNPLGHPADSAGAWNEFVSWAQSDPYELNSALLTAQTYLGVLR